MNRASSKGMVLPLILVVMIVVSGLVAAGFAITVADYRLGQSAIHAVRALGQAELYAAEATGTWADRDLRMLPVGDSMGVGGVRSVLKAGFGLFLFEGLGESGQGTARRRVGVLYATRAAPYLADRAVVADGSVRAAPGVVVLDSPAGRAHRCDLADSASAGWTVSGHLTGPLEPVGAWIRRATHTWTGGLSVTPSPSVLSGGCNVADILNWGDPGHVTRACDGHRPVIHVPGSISVLGGVGKGVLVVEGDLELSGGFVFEGLILVGGGLRTRGTGATIKGAVEVRAGGGWGLDLGDNTRITYSTCMLDEAVRWHGSIERIRPGGWLGEY